MSNVISGRGHSREEERVGGKEYRQNEYCVILQSEFTHSMVFGYLWFNCPLLGYFLDVNCQTHLKRYCHSKATYSPSGVCLRCAYVCVSLPCC